MIKNFWLFFFVLMVQIANAQVENPVQWRFSAKKINATTYEVHLTASIEEEWHIYSQSTPEGGPFPTSISFNQNSLVKPIGGINEVGKLEKRFEELFGVEVKQFGKKVDFVQTVMLKAPVKTSLAGSVVFMTCNDSQCLPPTTLKFSIALE